MTNGFLILGIGFILLMGMTGAAICIYVIIYRRIVNKRVREVNSTGEVRKPPLAPIAVFVILLGTLVLGFIIICMIAAVSWYSITDFGGEELIGAPIEMPDTNAEVFEAGDHDPLADISPEQEISGYTRHETKDGDYRFVYYTLYNNSQIIPAVLIYAEYTGEEGMNLYYETDCNDKSTDEVYESNSDGFLINEKGSWFVVNSRNFLGKVKLSLSASNDVTERDHDDRALISTGTLKIDYNDYFSPEAIEAVWDEIDRNSTE
ncbi:MAG: hypothetical protein IJ723_06265 [Ruminococcus sp.]|nr:hypothetical protein [Ruminococcus sp.]